MNAHFSLLIPFFSETITLEGSAQAAADFLTVGMAVDAVVLGQQGPKGCAVVRWSRGAGVAPATASARLHSLVLEGCASEGQEVERALGLEQGTRGLLLLLRCGSRPCGFVAVCRRGDAWAEAERQLCVTLQALLSASFAMQSSVERDTRSSFVLNTVMNAMRASVYVTELETDRILFMNQAMKEDFGIADPEGRLCYEVLQRGMHHRCDFCPVGRLLESGEESPVLQWDECNTVTGRSYRNYDSLIRWLDGSMVHLQQSVDVTDLKIANTDELTRLLGRRPGKAALQKTLDAARAQHDHVTVCFYDINNLKEINDQFGHAQGDRLLAAAAGEVQAVLQEGEYAFRMSGDEFAVVFLTRQGDAQRRLTQAQRALRLLDDQYDASFCFGLVELPPDHRVSAEDALRLADERMYEQKRRFHIARNQQRLRLVRRTPAGPVYSKESGQLYEAMARSTDEYPFLCNLKTGAFRYAPAMVEEFDLPDEILLNAAAIWGAKIHPEDQAAFLEANQLISDGRALAHCVEYRAKNRHGQWVWVRCRGNVITDEQEVPVLFAGFISPLGLKNRIDHLTGLPDKVELESCIRQHLEHTPQVPLGLLLLGADDLTHINELYDHGFGDEVLRLTALRLQALLPQGASLFRLEGDAFAIALPEASSGSMEALSHLIRYSFEGQQEYQGRKYYCTLSGGSALYPADAASFADLLKYAFCCLGLAKRRGKNCTVAYAAGILDHRARSLELVEALRTSVENNFSGFQLCFQPLVEPATGRLLGAEALARWSSPRFPVVSPLEFVPLLEQTGMILPVGLWALRSAIALCRPWLRQCPDFALHVNLSYLQLQDSALVSTLLRTLRSWDFPCRNLVLELTESQFVQDNQHVQRVFEELRGHGVRTAVDDFGTGFSSLSVLKNIPADIVKIDKAFLRNIRASAFDATFIRFVVALCHQVGIRVCLEGVETTDEQAVVGDMGLDVLQGYLFGRPVPAEAFASTFLPEGGGGCARTSKQNAAPTPP